MMALPKTDKYKWQDRVRSEFKGKSVISDWGHRRTYIVDDVIFDRNPNTQTFDVKGVKTTVAKYFAQEYKKQVKYGDQPLLLIKMGDKHIHLPPEFCLIDGVPDAIMKDGRRDALKAIQQNPQ